MSRRKMGVWVLYAGLTVACGRSEDAGNAVESPESIDLSETVPTEDTGCLTANGDRFVLSSPDAQGPGTELYQLVGAEDELRKHVGKVVRISGEAEPPQTAELRQPPVPAAGTAGDEAKPTVATGMSLSLDVRTLRVIAVVPTGDVCAKLK